MKAWQFLIVLGIIIGVSIYLGIRDRSNQREVMQAIDAAKAEQAQILNTDTIQSRIERSVMRKLKDSLDQRDKQIKQLKTDLIKTRKKNEELYNLYRSLSVDMPDY